MYCLAMNKVIPIVLVLFLSAAICFSLDVGEEAPTFANPDLQGRYVLSSKIVGKNWLLVDFFATYCEPCKEEVPQLEKIRDDFSDYGLEVLIFSVDKEGKEVISPYFTEQPTTLSVLIDRYKVTANRYGVEKLPTVFLVDEQGLVVYKAEGYRPSTIAELRGILEENLKP